MARADDLQAAWERYRALAVEHHDPLTEMEAAIPDLLAVTRALQDVARTADRGHDLILWRIATDALAAFEAGG